MTPFAPWWASGEVREARLALERQAAEEPAGAGPGHRQARAGDVHLFHQQPAVRQPGHLPGHPRTTAEQRGEEAGALAAVAVERRLHDGLAAAPAEAGGSGRPRQPVAPGVRAVDRDLAGQDAAARLAVEGSGKARSAHRGPADDPLGLTRHDADREALGAYDLAREIGLAAGHEVGVVGAGGDVHCIEAVGRLRAGDLEPRLRPEHVLIARQQARGRQRDPAVRLAALRRPRPPRLHRNQVAAAARHLEASPAGGARGAGLDQERPVGRQPERAGHRAALGLAGVHGQPDGLVAAKVEGRVQAVAGVGQAGGVDMPRHAAEAPQLEGAVDVVEPVARRERRQQLDPRGELVDGHRYRRATPRGRSLWRGRPQHRQQTGVQLTDGEAPAQQLRPVPPHTDGSRIEPWPVVIADGQSPDGEVAPDVALETLDVQTAVSSEVQAIEG